MVSLIWDKRAIPLYWELLPKLGSSNWSEQKAAIQQVLSLFKNYKVEAKSGVALPPALLPCRFRRPGILFGRFGKLAQDKAGVLLLASQAR